MPSFLIVFFIAIGAWVASIVWRWWSDPTRNLPPLPLRNPYQIALLRGGRPAVLHLGILSLSARRAVFVTPDGSLQALERESSEPIEQTILNHLQTPISLKELKKQSGLHRALDLLLAPMQDALVRDRLIRSDGPRLRWLWLSLCVISGGAAFIFDNGFTYGIFALLTFQFLTSRVKRITQRGQKSLDQAALAVRHHRDEITSGRILEPDTLLLCCALIPAIALQGTAYDHLSPLMPQHSPLSSTSEFDFDLDIGDCSSWSDSSDSGSSDSGGDSGGSCGGGCGGGGD